MRELAPLDPFTTRYNRDFSGEEFIAVLPGASLTDVGIVGEGIRRAVADLTIMEGDQIIKIRISLGGIFHPELNVSDEEALIPHADTLLYRSKNSGKNKLELHSLSVG